MIWAVLKWLREVGILLLTLSLLFLPWYLDPEPEPGQSALITGIEFVASGSLLVVAGYMLSLLTYYTSRFTKREGTTFILFIVTGFLYYVVHVGATQALGGLGLGRPTSTAYLPARTLIGGQLNFVGLFALGVGMYAAFEPVEK